MRGVFFPYGEKRPDFFSASSSGIPIFQEELNRRHFRNQDELKHSAFVYIEGFYNPKRPHSANSNLSLDKKEDMFKKRTTPIS